MEIKNLVLLIIMLDIIAGVLVWQFQHVIDLTKYRLMGAMRFFYNRKKEVLSFISIWSLIILILWASLPRMIFEIYDYYNNKPKTLKK